MLYRSSRDLVCILTVFDAQDEHYLLLFVNAVEYSKLAKSVSPGLRLVPRKFLDVEAEMRFLFELRIHVGFDLSIDF
jgi:hypothetical protein